MVDPWGRPRDKAQYLEGFAHGPTAAALGTSGDRNRQLFTGHEYDQDSGLYYAKARYLDPEAGRFISRDSYLGEASNPQSLQRYAYANSNPALFIDPSGHFGQLKDWTDQMNEAAEVARENYQKSDGGWVDVLAGVGAKFAGGIVGVANLASDAALLSTGVEGLEDTEYGGQARDTMYGLDAQIQGVRRAGREGRLLEGAQKNLLDPLAMTVGGTLMGDDGTAFDLMTGAGAFVVDTVATMGAGKVAALTRSASLGRSLARSSVTTTAESSSGMVRSLDVPQSRAAFVRPGAQMADEWAGSVGAARAHAPAPPATTGGRFRGLTSLGDEAGAPMVSRVQKASGTRGGAGEGFIRYGDLDDFGRPTGVQARITQDMIGTGTPASGKLQPPGFIAGKGSNRARGHLLGDQLGGSGTDARNLVTLEQLPANSPVMRGFETRIRQAVEAGEVVDFSATPLYNFTGRIPRGITLKATGSSGFSLDVTVVNPPGMGRGWK